MRTKKILENVSLQGFLLALILIASYSNHSFAGGPVHGGKAAGMGTAFIAVADDPSAILHNPAGIAQLEGNNIYTGITGVIPSSSYKNSAGNKESTDFQVFFPPHFYQTIDFGLKDFTFGLGLHSPFGIGGRKWSKNGLTRYLSTEAWIATFTVNPTVAYKLTPSIFIAVGLNYMNAINEAEKMADQSFFGAGDGKMRLETDGDGWGYNLGFLCKPNDQFKIGLAYRSPVTIDFNGDITVSAIAPALQPAFGGNNYKADITTKSEFPEIFSFGIAYLPDNNWTIAFDVEWVCWSSFDKATLNIKQEVPAAGLVDGTTVLDWEDSLQFKVGFDYKLNDKYSLRGGYAYIQTPVPDHTIEPSNPDSDMHNVSMGLGCRSGKWRYDVFYNYSLYEDRKVNNSILSGEYKNNTHFIGLSLGYRFGKEV